MRRPSRVTQQTLAITSGLAVAAAGITAFWATPPTILTGRPTWFVASALVVAFLLGEQLLMNVEFRRQAHSMTLAGIPLVLGALLAPLQVAVLARVLGAGIALGLQRMRPDKFAYNIAAYAFEAAVDTAVIHALLGTRTSLDLAAAMTVLLVVTVVDQLMSCLVLVVIRLHTGPLSRRDVLEVLVPAAVLAVVTGAAAIGTILLVRDGPIGWTVIAVATFAAVVLYRSYLTTTKRHQALELIHDFVSGSVGAESFTAAARDLLARIRTLLRAASVEMMVLPDATDVTDPAGLSQRVTRYIDAEDGFAAHSEDHAALDWAELRTLSHLEPLLAPRSSKDRAVQGWLRERGCRDAMMVPFPTGSGVIGTITVTDRLGETATFTADDLTLLQTLTGHLAIASKSARMVERLAYDANHDALTGLYNRGYLSRRIADPPGGLGMPTVLMLDLDRFKEVNDTLGHAAGDELLCVVARRLTALLPAAATIARLGGDEFAIYLADVQSEAAAREIAERVASELSQPVSVAEALLNADASIGIAQARRRSRTDLLRQADTAMYAAKNGDATIAIYDQEMDRGRAENLAILADLRSTLHEHPEHFMLHYQPKIDLASRTVVSAEALVRWNHPELGILSPDRFIPLAEASGLIDQFTPVLLEAALRECRRWDDLGIPISVAVNLSARTVGDPTLPHQLGSALARAGVPAARLIIEITESSVIAEPQQTLRVLQSIADLGVCVSLDDFGTGYSSLAYLHRLPAGEVKIDKSFVQGLSSADATSSRALISAITSLGRNLGMRVVAEGVEHDSLLIELEQLGCHVAQGYTIARPMPAEAFQSWLRDYQSRTPEPLHLLKAL